MMIDRTTHTEVQAKATTEATQAGGEQSNAPVPRPRDKRDRIIEAAIMVFHEHGYERARISDITDSLGIAKGTLYLYFQSKKELLLACLVYANELIGGLEEGLEVRGGDFFSNLSERLRRVDQYSWFTPLVDLARVSEHSPDPEVSDKAREFSRFGVARLMRDLVKAMQDGRIRDIDPELAVWAYVGMADGVRRRVLEDDRYSVAEGEDFVVEAMTAWLSPNPCNATKRDGFAGTAEGE